MQISLVAAIDRNRVIGRNNSLPWHLPADLKWFKKNTLGKLIIMGRKTFESIGKPLPGRTNIVLSRDKNFLAEGCRVVHSVDEVVEMAREGEGEGEEMMVIGGEQLFRLFISRASRLYLTRIDAEFEGDSYFPALEASEWRVTWRDELPQSDDNPYDLQFVILERFTPSIA